MDIKPRGWNRASPAEREAMMKGCTCQENGFGNKPDEPCPYHSKPHYHSYALGEHGEVHFLIRMPSGWLVGIPEHQIKETMELTEPGEHPPYETHTLVRPEETREPPDDPAKAADALSKFVPMHSKKGAKPEVTLEGLESKVKHILHWLVEWGQQHDASVGTFWNGINELRAENARLAERVVKIEAGLKDLAKQGGGTPIEDLELK